MSGFMEKIDEKAANSKVAKFFEMESRNAKFSTELRGASATFLAWAHVLAVNPRTLADSGGPCVAPDGNMFSEEYENCLAEIKRQHVTATQWHPNWTLRSESWDSKSFLKSKKFQVLISELNWEWA